MWFLRLWQDAGLKGLLEGVEILKMVEFSEVSLLSPYPLFQIPLLFTLTSWSLGARGAPFPVSAVPDARGCAAGQRHSKTRSLAVLGTFQGP